MNRGLPVLVILGAYQRGAAYGNENVIHIIQTYFATRLPVFFAFQVEYFPFFQRACIVYNAEGMKFEQSVIDPEIIASLVTSHSRSFFSAAERN